MRQCTHSKDKSMETLTEQIQHTTLKGFGEGVKKELNDLIVGEPNKLKTYIALLIFGKEIVRTLETMPIEGLIKQMQDELDDMKANVGKLDSSCQLHLSENESVMQMLAGEGPKAEFDKLQSQIKELLRLQDDFLRQLVTQQEKKSFEAIATETSSRTQL